MCPARGAVTIRQQEEPMTSCTRSQMRTPRLGAPLDCRFTSGGAYVSLERVLELVDSVRLIITHRQTTPMPFPCGFARLALALLIGMVGCQKAKPPPPPPPPEVEVLTVVAEDVSVYQAWIGSLDGFVNAQIRAQVSGYLMSQNYKEGALVKKGEVLFQIDPRTFEAALGQAKAQFGHGHRPVGQDRAGRQTVHPAGQGRRHEPGGTR